MQVHVWMWKEMDEGVAGGLLVEESVVQTGEGLVLLGVSLNLHSHAPHTDTFENLEREDGGGGQ